MAGYTLEDDMWDDITQDWIDKMVKKAKSEAHTRMAGALAPHYLSEVHRILDNQDLNAVQKAKALYALETDLWDLLGE